jgi:hypothetical protein
MEDDRATWRVGRVEQLIEQGEDLPELLVHSVIAPTRLLFQPGQALGQLLVDGQELAEADKGPHDLDVDLDGAGTAKEPREHGYALFGESIGEILPMSAAAEL